MSNKGNQTGHEVTDAEETVDSLYNPGHSGNGETDRSGNVTLNSNDDISKEAKTTLGSYLSSLTQGKVTKERNAFAINNSPKTFEGHSEISDAHSQKDPDAKFNSGMTAGTFLDIISNLSDDGPDAKSKFLDTKHSDYGDKNPFVGTFVKNRAANPGHTLLASTVSVDPTSTVLGSPGVPTGADDKPEDFPIHQRRISQVLKQNRFNPSGETPFMRDNEKTEFGYTVQTEMGAYDPDAAQARENQLKKVGLRLIANATGHNDISVNDVDLALAPTLAQFTGFPVVDEKTLHPQNTPQGEKLTKKRSDLLNGTFNRKSYGQLNSHLEYFDGPMPLGMLTTTVAGMGGLIGLTGTVAGILSLVVGPTPPSKGFNPRNPSEIAMGKYARVDAELPGMFSELFGIPRTDFAFMDCVFMGIVSFYGIETLPEGEPPSALTIIDSFLNIAMAPGYYAVVTRNVIRDTEQIADAVAEFSALPPIGVSAGVTAVFKLIESIVNSSSYRFLMAMAALGNQVLHANKPYKPVHNKIDSLPDTAPNRHKKSRRGKNKSNPKGQGSTHKGAMSWRHSSAPARYILPHSFITAINIAGKFGFGNADAAISSITAYKEGSSDPTDAIERGDAEGKSNLGTGEGFKEKFTPVPGRLPSEYVEFIENGLEAEYMPFYFHDLRTNEIISFHAFMTDLADGFSAEYSTMSGYGRADDVHIYNKTTRNISLGFMIAATSPADLDIMYFNINKLVSMMYPQYSRGRVVVHGKGREADRFVQPFSQIPTASPMIRLRFGDILKSNYSKFNIARLFGIGQNDNSFNLTKKTAMDDVTKTRIAEALAAANKKMGDTILKSKLDPGASNEFQKAYFEAIGVEAVDDTEVGYQTGQLVNLDASVLYWPRDNTGKTATENGEKRGDSESDALDLFSYGSHLPEVEVVARVPTAGSASPPAFSGMKTETSETGYVEPKEQEGKSMAYLVKVPSAGPTKERYIDTTKYVYHRAQHDEIVGLSENWIAEELRKATAGIEDPSTKRAKVNSETLIGEFLHSKNNPIIRSFESSRGKGLAGFMTELSFDWAEAPWEIELGKRAPMFMKVSVTFKPIHDVPMGLDSEGMMRSVAYPVGISRALNGEVYDDGSIKEKTSHAKGTAPAKGAGTHTDESKADKATEAAAKATSTT